MNAGFEQAFGIVSPRERRQAELFFRDLLGHGTRSRCTCGCSAQPGEQFGKAIGKAVERVGTGVGAALGAANAFASGQRIDAALLAAARAAIPGGPSKAAFDMAVKLAVAQRVEPALLAATRARLPPGRAQAAFDTGLALGRGRMLQDAALARGRRLTPSHAPSALPSVQRALGGANLGRDDAFDLLFDPAPGERDRVDVLASDLFGPGEAADESSAASPEEAPAPPTRDVAVTERMALLVTTHAPLPVTAAEIDRTRGDQGALDDYKSVCAIVPAVPENRLLIYFHGNNQYVTVAPRGDVRPSAEPSRHSRAPRWADERARARAVAKAATPFDFGLTSLAERQRGLAPSEAFSALPVKDPIVLAPEDAELKKAGDYWSVPPKKQYGAAAGEAPNGPGAQRFSNLVLECYERLRALPNPSGQRYLDPNMTSRASWVSNVRRVYLSGHSGGGKPLLEAAGSELVLVGSSSVMGVGGRAVDLWLFDCTYGFGTQGYVNFCQNWHDAGLLGAGPNASRLVCVYRPGTPEKGTEAEADRLRSALAKVLGAKADSLRKLHDSTDMASRSMREDVIPALTSSPVIFIRTHVGHDQIPTLFTPLLLRTAAS